MELCRYTLCWLKSGSYLGTVPKSMPLNFIDQLEEYRESLWPTPLSTRQKKINKVYNELKPHLQKLHAGFYAVHFNKLDQLFSSFSLQKQFNELQENSITEHRCKLVYIE